MTGAPLKRCPQCGKSFPRTSEYWHKHSQSHDGLFCWCRSCALARARARKQARKVPADKPRAGLTIHQRGMTPWGAFTYGKADSARRADLDTSDDLSLLHTTLEDVRPHFSDRRRAPLPSLGED